MKHATLIQKRTPPRHPYPSLKSFMAFGYLSQLDCVTPDKSAEDRAICLLMQDDGGLLTQLHHSCQSLPVVQEGLVTSGPCLSYDFLLPFCTERQLSGCVKVLFRSRFRFFRHYNMLKRSAARVLLLTVTVMPACPAA
jgi:hypothetical protein